MLSQVLFVVFLVAVFTFSSFYAHDYSAGTDGTYPTSCQDVQKMGHNISDFYVIQPKYAPEPFVVLCDMNTRGGGWTYILNRFDGSQNFYLNWDNYKYGFGHLGGEFWLGLQNINYLTGYEINELLIELVDWDHVQKHAHYNTFSIGNKKIGYSLKLISGYSGDAGDCMTHEAGMKFTTKDRDQDDKIDGNCAVFSNSGWWFRDCKWAHLTGKYYNSSDAGPDYLQAMYWAEWHGNKYSLKQARMMVRPRVEGHPKLLPASKFQG